MMYNSYLYEKLAHAHHQELLLEAEQQRLLAQLPRRHSQLMHSGIKRLAAFLMSLPFSVRKVEQSARPATGQL